jgi:tetratricopeptide (TPR) repeat protein
MISGVTSRGTIRLLTGITLLMLVTYSLYVSSKPEPVIAATPSAAAGPQNETGIKSNNEFSALFHQGIGLLGIGKANESIPYFDKALAIDPKSVSALYFKGAALLRLGKANESIPYFDKALAIQPTSFNLLTIKGAALLRLGKANESIPYIDKALAIDPSYSNALNLKKAALESIKKIAPFRGFIP